MSEQNRPTPQPAEQNPQPAPRQISPRLALVGTCVVIAAFGVVAVLGIGKRLQQNTVLADQTIRMAAPSVSVAPPAAGASINTFTLPGNVTAYTDSPIYARTSGYLTRWYYDIGAHVRQGALLAVIATPEVDQQLAQAEADLATAQANAANAHIQADRYSGLVGANAVSRQDTDTYVNQAAATAATVRSAQANVDRLKQLQSFEKVYAPFDGVVTARQVDIGQLIDAGAGKELFHMQALQTLRVYTSLPQTYAPTIHNGMKMDVTFAERPAQNFTGTLVRTSQAIDPTSRTLLVEVDVDNRSGELLPGALATVHFKTPRAEQVAVVPSAALIFRKEGMLVATLVNGNQAHLLPVIIGEDDGATVQIIHGLSTSDQVIQDPPDSLIDGEVVQVTHTNHPVAQGK